MAIDKLVYIIDDDQVYLKFMTEHFKRMGGFITEIFLNGDEAINMLNKRKPAFAAGRPASAAGRPDIIILDNHLEEPNKSGIHYLKLLSKVKPRIPVIYITADTDIELRKTVEKMGVESFILKDSSFLVYLRTALDDLTSLGKKKSIIKKIFSR
jgi:CheY-like chemotaxis protein